MHRTLPTRLTLVTLTPAAERSWDTPPQLCVFPCYSLSIRKQVLCQQLLLPADLTYTTPSEEGRTVPSQHS